MSRLLGRCVRVLGAPSGGPVKHKCSCREDHPHVGTCTCRICGALFVSVADVVRFMEAATGKRLRADLRAYVGLE
jgi:hypothetical protein